MSCARSRRCTPSAAITIPKAWAARFPERRTLRLGGLRIYVMHDRAELAKRPAPGGSRVIITGHSHKPLLETWDGALFVNPGSAGPRRFNLPVAIGEIEIRGRALARAPHRSVDAPSLARLERQVGNQRRTRDASRMNW